MQLGNFARGLTKVHRCLRIFSVRDQVFLDRSWESWLGPCLDHGWGNLGSWASQGLSGSCVSWFGWVGRAFLGRQGEVLLLVLHM